MDPIVRRTIGPTARRPGDLESISTRDQVRADFRIQRTSELSLRPRGQLRLRPGKGGITSRIAPAAAAVHSEARSLRYPVTGNVSGDAEDERRSQWAVEGCLARQTLEYPPDRPAGRAGASNDPQPASLRPLARTPRGGYSTAMQLRPRGSCRSTSSRSKPTVRIGLTSTWTAAWNGGVHSATPTKPKPWPGRSPESVARCFTAERISIAHIAACRQTGRRPGDGPRGDLAHGRYR
jgi:hypothetical protein